MGLGGRALIQMLESRVINPWRIGSFQSENEPLVAELADDVVTVDNGLQGLAGWDVGNNGDSSRHHKLDASRMDSWTTLSPSSFPQTSGKAVKKQGRK